MFLFTHNYATRHNSNITSDQIFFLFNNNIASEYDRIVREVFLESSSKISIINRRWIGNAICGPIEVVRMSIHRSLPFNLSQQSAKKRYHINRVIDPQPAAKNDPNIYCFNTCWSFTVVRWYIEWSRTKSKESVCSRSRQLASLVCLCVCKWMLFLFYLNGIHSVLESVKQRFSISGVLTLR